MKIAGVVIVAACGGSSPARTAPPLPLPPPPPYTGHVDVRARVDPAQLDPALTTVVEERCITTEEVARLETGLTTARERALVVALDADLQLRPIALESAIERREGNDPIAPGTPVEGRFDEPWTEVERDGARWLVGPSDTVDCGLDQPAFGESRFVIGPTGDVQRLEVRVLNSRNLPIRTCAPACPTGSGMCGAHMPATVQIRWKLPTGARFVGHLVAGIESPVLRPDPEPRRKPCPEFQPPP